MAVGKNISLPQLQYETCFHISICVRSSALDEEYFYADWGWIKQHNFHLEEINYNSINLMLHVEFHGCVKWYRDFTNKQ